MANAENRSYPLKRKVLAGGGIVAGFGIALQGALTGPSSDASDYKLYASNIDGVIAQTEKFKTEQGDQAVILLEGVKAKLEKNPEYKNAKKESAKTLTQVLIGGGIALGSLAVGALDRVRFENRRSLRKHGY